MSASEQQLGPPGALTATLLGSRRRALAIALLGALCLHLGALLFNPTRRVCAVPSTLEPGEPQVWVDVEPPPAPKAEDESGGGSFERALNRRAEGEVPPAPKAPARVVAALDPKPTPVPPTPKLSADQVQPEHGDAEEAPAEDLFAIDSLLTAESEQRVPSQLRPRPAWRSVSNSSALLPAMPGKVSAAARNFGTGAGAHGGVGGEGRRAVHVTKENMPFGGNSGAFRGQVCSIPRGTPSIRSLGACQPVRELYTDTFNIPTRAFELGFPGLPGQNEWFAILYTGSFEVERSGTYEFRLASDDGSILELDDQLVIDNDGTHGPVSRRGKLQLQAGTHALRLRYFQGPRNLVSLQLFVTPPGRGERLFRPKF